MADTFATRTLREMFRVLFRGAVFIVFFTAVAAGLTWFLCTQATPIYRSTVSLIFKQPVGKSPVFQESPERTLEVFVKAQQQIVMSDLVLARAKVIAEDEKLRTQWIALRDRELALRRQRSDPSEPYDAERGRQLEDVQAQINDFLTRKGPGGRNGTVADRVAELMTSRQKDLNDFRDDVRLKTPGGEQVAMTESFQIRVDRPAPSGQRDGYLNAQYAADVLADMYMVRFREFQTRLSGAAGEFMKRVVEEHNKVVAAAQKRLDVFIEKELDSAGDVAILEQLLKSGTEHGYQIIATRARETTLRLSDDLARAKSLRELFKQLLPEKAMTENGVNDMTREEVSAAVAVVPPEVLETNIVVNRMTGRLIAAKAKEAEIAPKLTAENRALRDVREEIERTQRNLLGEMVAHARSLDITIASLEDRIKDNDSNLKGIEGRLDKINRRLTEYQRLKNDVLVSQKQHQDIQEEQVAAFTAEERARAAVTIDKLDDASRPAVDKPAQPLTLIYTIIAGAVGFFLAVALAFLSAHFDHTIRTIEDAERYLGLPVVGSVSKRGRSIVA